MWHCKYSVNSWMPSKIIWKYQIMKISCFHITYILQPTFLAERYKCHFNVLSPPIHGDSYSWKTRHFFKIAWQILSKLAKSVKNFQHPILWRNHQNWNFSFRNFLLRTIWLLYLRDNLAVGLMMLVAVIWKINSFMMEIMVFII